MPYSKREWIDEILAEDPKYLITLSTRDGEPVGGDDAGEIFDHKARIELNVDTLVEGTPVNASVMNDMESRIGTAIDRVEEMASAGVGNLGGELARVEREAAKLAANQTFTGTNTFRVLPQVMANPTGDNQLARKAYVDGAVSAAKPQLRSTTVAGGWQPVNDSGQTVYRKTTGITGAGNAFPLLAAASGQIVESGATMLQAVNVDGTIYLYADIAITSALSVTVILLETR